MRAASSQNDSPDPRRAGRTSRSSARARVISGEVGRSWSGHLGQQGGSIAAAGDYWRGSPRGVRQGGRKSLTSRLEPRGAVSAPGCRRRRPIRQAVAINEGSVS
jgi:hypothetical protein